MAASPERAVWSQRTSRAGGRAGAEGSPYLQDNRTVRAPGEGEEGLEGDEV